MPDQKWWESHDNISQLAWWMAWRRDMFDIEDLAMMVEKPWKFTDEWQECQEYHAKEQAHA